MNTQNSDGNTPMHVICQSRADDSVQLMSTLSKVGHTNIFLFEFVCFDLLFAILRWNVRSHIFNLIGATCIFIFFFSNLHIFF